MIEPSTRTEEAFRKKHSAGFDPLNAYIAYISDESQEKSEINDVISITYTNFIENTGELKYKFDPLNAYREDLSTEILKDGEIIRVNFENRSILNEVKNKESGDDQSPALQNSSYPELVRSFEEALTADGGQTHVDVKAVSEAMVDLARSGRLGDWFARATEMANEPPTRAPRSWEPASGQTPAEAIVDVFGYWIDRGRFHLGVLRSLNRPLYDSFYSWKRSNQVPESLAEKLLTSTEYNTKKLAENPPDNPVERVRLQRVKGLRQYRSKQM
jgi:hypothetical protein